MLNNLCYPIPTIGRICIGFMKDDNGRRRPVRLDHFLITTKYKENGEWVLHKAHQAVAKAVGSERDEVTRIPVKILFNNPSLTIRERNEAYHEGHLVCASGKNGQARQVSEEGIKTLPCPGPNQCHFARTCSHGCDVMGRINLQINVDDAENFGQDSFSTFIMRTRGYNSVQTVRQKLEMAHAMFPAGIVGIPFELRLKKKSSPTSKNSAFYYVDLAMACSLEEAARASKAEAERLSNLGLNQEAMETAVLNGLNNSMFEDAAEEMGELEDLLIAPEAPSVTSTRPAVAGVIPGLGAAEAQNDEILDLSMPSDPAIEQPAAADQSGVEANPELVAPIVEPPSEPKIGLDSLRSYIESAAAGGLQAAAG